MVLIARALRALFLALLTMSVMSEPASAQVPPLKVVSLNRGGPSPQPVAVQGGDGSVTRLRTRTPGACTVNDAPPYFVTYVGPHRCRLYAVTRPNEPANPLADTMIGFSGLVQDPLTVWTISGETGSRLRLLTIGGSGSGLVTYTVTDGTAKGCTVLNETPTWTDALVQENKFWGQGTRPPQYLTASGAGTCIVTATKAAAVFSGPDENYWAQPVSSAPTEVTFSTRKRLPVTPGMTINQTPGLFGTPLQLTVNNECKLGNVKTYFFFDSTTGGTDCYISATAPFTLTSAQATTCDVFAVQVGPGYIPRFSQRDIKSGQEIGCEGGMCNGVKAAVRIDYGPQPPLAVTPASIPWGALTEIKPGGGGGNGDLAVLSVAPGSSGCTLSTLNGVYKLSAPNPGTCSVQVSRGAEGPWLAKTETVPVTFTPREQYTPLILIAARVGTYGKSIPLSANGGSGTGAITFTATDGSPPAQYNQDQFPTPQCGVTPSPFPPYELFSRGAGACVVTAKKAGDARYLEASSTPARVDFQPLVQAALTVTSTAGRYGTPLTLTTSGGTGDSAVTYTVADGTGTGCAISKTTPYQLTSTKAGTCKVTAQKAATATHFSTKSPETIVLLSQ